MLERYDWPGNIRQLQNVLERAVLMAETALISRAELDSILNEESSIHLPEAPPESSRQSRPMRISALATDGRSYQWVDSTQTQEILDALQRARGNKTQAARLLNLSLRQLRYRIAKLGLEEKLGL